MQQKKQDEKREGSARRHCTPTTACTDMSSQTAYIVSTTSDSPQATTWFPDNVPACASPVWKLMHVEERLVRPQTDWKQNCAEGWVARSAGLSFELNAIPDTALFSGHRAGSAQSRNGYNITSSAIGNMCEVHTTIPTVWGVLS